MTTRKIVSVGPGVVEAAKVSMQRGTDVSLSLTGV